MNIIIFMIIMHSMLVLTLVFGAHFALCLFVYPKLPFVKKFVGSFETYDEYILVGIWGFTDNEVKKKVKYLRRHGIYYDGLFSPIREVEQFPEYLDFNRIY